MAWNEPGGGNNKDPWGGKDQGPPDLDEAFKKLQSKLNSLFGGGGSSGGGTGNVDISGGFIALICLVIVVIWAGFGVYQVDEKERAVVLRLGKYLETYEPGLHWNPPLIDFKYVVSVTEERQYASRGLMLTEDENIVESPLTVQYNIKDPKAFVLNVKDPVLSLQEATDSALRHVVGSSKLDDVVSSGREKIGVEVQIRLQRYLDNYGTGIRVVKINIQEAKPPVEVKDAYDDVIKAREDQERLINEAQAYSNGIIPESRGKAQRMIEEANGYRAKVVVEAEGESQRFENLLSEYKKAPEVTRERMYMDTIQGVMRNSSKVLIDVEGGNNMLYLPLDKITQARPSFESASAVDSTSISDIADEVIKKLRREQMTSRRGEPR
ncbi:MAG: FtsH protease activity modulator HflK [Spongiibacteraceae bacterium]|nr:FtsH protease activity modulator HflK [Spongiibacteraceae bacterium]